MQSRQKGSAEAELPIFGNEDTVLVEKPIFRSLAVKIERKCGSETANLWKPGRDEMRKWNFTSLEVLAEQVRKAEFHIFGSPGRTSAEAELHIFGSQYRAEVQKRNLIFLAVRAELKCGRGTSDLWQ